MPRSGASAVQTAEKGGGGGGGERDFVFQPEHTEQPSDFLKGGGGGGGDHTHNGK